MVKYIIIKYNPDGYGGNLSEIKTVRKNELKEYLDNDWFIKKKVIPIITPFLDWWNQFNINQKIAILTIIIPLFFGGLGWCLNKYFDNKYNDLKHQHDQLYNDYNLKEQTLILLSDSLKIERKKIQDISQQMQLNKESYKNEVDSLKQN